MTNSSHTGKSHTPSTDTLNSTNSPTSPNKELSRYPCGTCDNSVKWTQKGVACESCGHWFHASCENIGSRTYSHLNNSEISWHCFICGKPNYSTTAFDLHGVANNDHSLTDSTLSIPQSNNKFTPKHVSTPTRQSSPKQQNGKWRPLRALNVNFRSIVGKHAEILNLIDSTKPDIITGTETWLDPSVQDNELFPDGYKTYRKDRNREGGGVLVAVRDDIETTRIPELETDCEMVWVKINTHHNKTLYVCSYYHPHTGDTIGHEQFETSIKRALKSRGNFIISGDFNLPGWDWNNRTIKPGTSHKDIHLKFGELLSETGLEQMVQTPTKGDNTLDLVLTNSPHLVPRLNVIPGVSDHDIVFFEFESAIKVIRQSPRQVPLYNKANWENMKEDMRKLHLLLPPNDTPIEELWDTFKTALHKTMIENIPNKTVKPKTNLPWLSKELKGLIKKKVKLYKQMKKAGSEEIKTEYKELRRKTQRLIRRAHWQYVGGLFEQTDQESDIMPTKRFWTYVKNKRSSKSCVSSLKVEGRLVTDPKEKAEALNAQFYQAFSEGKEYSPHEFHNKCTMPEDPQHYKSITKLEITENGVSKLLEKLNPRKASGPDNIPPKVLKELATEIAPTLTHIYTASLTQGAVPQDWKDAMVTPIYKKGEHYDPGNYRPVSLTSVPCKVMEHIIVSHMMTHLEKNNILCPQQHGFRKGRSCETQLIEFSNHVIEKMEKGLQTDVIVMDFAKAFDKVNHSLLRHKLEHYGIRGKTNDWISNLLHNRRQVVVVDNSKSDPVPVKSGVPQGSVVGPALFLIYINDLPTRVTSDSRLFADDTLIHQTIESQHDQESLQTDLDSLEVWEAQWDMTFHPQKCNAMHMTKKKTVEHKSYSLHGHTLENASSVKYLGITIQQNGGWGQHINNMTSKANRTLGFLRRNLKIGSSKVKEMAYKALVRPITEYAATVWDPHQDLEISKIEAVQRRAARFVLNQYQPTASVSKMLNRLKWKTLKQRRREARCKMLYKIKHELVAIKTTDLKAHERKRGHNKAFQTLQCRTDYRKFSFFPRTITDWNALPQNTVDAPSLESFVSRLKAK